MAHDPRQHTPDWRRLSAAINRNALRKQRLLRDVFVSRNRFVVASAYDDDDAVFARGTELPRPVPAKSLEKLPGPAAATSSEELRVPAPGQSSEELLVDFLVESMLDDMIRDLG